MASKFPLVLYTGPNQIKEIIAADTVDKAALPSDTVYLTGAQTLTGKTLATGTVAADFSVGSARVLDLAGAGGGTTNDRVKISSQAAGSGAVVETVSSNPNASLLLKSKGSSSVEVFQGATSLGSVVGTTGTQTLTNKTLTLPAISDFTQATHDHLTPAGGDLLDAAAIATGTLGEDRLADTQYRDATFAYGRANRVLRSDDTNVGSGGTAQWTERERIAQLKMQGAFTVGAATAVYTTLSQFVLGGSESHWDTLPDITKETGTVTSTPLAYNTSLYGKTIRITAGAKITHKTTGSATTIKFQLVESAATLMEISYAFAAVPGSSTTSNVAFQFVTTWRGDTTAGNVYRTIVPTCRVTDRTGLVVANTNMFVDPTLGSSTSIAHSPGSTTTYLIQAQLINGGGADVILMEDCIWEVLN